MINLPLVSKFYVFALIQLICHSLIASENIPQKINTQVCVIGAGSAGIGAALAASRAGADVVLIEKEGIVGGTSTSSYVNNWAPGPDCSYAQEIYNRLSKNTDATGIAPRTHGSQKTEPYGIYLANPDFKYVNTLRRSDIDANKYALVVFDIDEFNNTVKQMLNETGKCKLLLNTVFTKAYTKNGVIESVEAVSASGEKYLIQAKIFLDCSGNASLCRDIGCEIMVGEEPQSRFGEPSAPEEESRSVNAISLCYQVKPFKNKTEINTGSPDDFDYRVSAHVDGPVGTEKKLTVNPLGIIEGNTLLKQDANSLYEYGKKLVDRHWAKLRTYPHFKNYEFDSYAPKLGIRESYRVACEYILTQHDLLLGLSGQKHNDIITVADHAMDVHGKNGVLNNLKEAYGVPYRCLIPIGWDNLFVAGRCAGFSHIAASSCRLSRTMMSLGHAAGFAAWLCVSRDRPVWDIPIEKVQAEMNLKLRPKEIMNAEPLPIKNVIGDLDYSFYCSDNGNDSIYQVSKSGKIVWSYPASNCQDIWSLPNGNVLFTYHHGINGFGGVTEVTKDKEVIFNYEMKGEVHTCQRLDNGNTLIGVNNSAVLIEVDKQGNIKKKTYLKTEERGHYALRMARKLGNGNYLVYQSGDSLVAEYNKRGKLIKKFLCLDKGFEAVRLKNGNTMVSNGAACTISELDKKGKVVWKITKDDFPEIKMNWLAGFEVLPNGNILICNWLGHGKYGQGIPVFEITREKEVVFYYTDNVRTRSISNIFPLIDE